MESAHFKELLAVFQHQQLERFQQLLTHCFFKARKSLQRPSNKYNSILRFLSRREKLPNYLERLEHYYTFKELTQNESIPRRFMLLILLVQHIIMLVSFSWHI